MASCYVHIYVRKHCINQSNCCASSHARLARPQHPYPEPCHPGPPWATEVLEGERAEKLDEGGTVARFEQSLHATRRDQHHWGCLRQEGQADCKHVTTHEAAAHQDAQTPNWEACTRDTLSGTQSR